MTTAMASRASVVTTTYEPDKIIQPVYTGGNVALDIEGRILATCLGEDALLTDLTSGESLARIEGVSQWEIFCDVPAAYGPHRMERF